MRRGRRGGWRRGAVVRVGIAWGDAQLGELIGGLRGRGRRCRRPAGAGLLLLDRIGGDRRLPRRVAGEDGGEQNREEDEGETGQPDPYPLHKVVSPVRRMTNP